MAVDISFCVVNTDQRELLLRCLDAIGAEREQLDLQTEVLVLDNGSTDGSAAAARQHPATSELLALAQRRGKGENDSELLQRARALLPAAQRGLRAAAGRDGRIARGA